MAKDTDRTAALVAENVELRAEAEKHRLASSAREGFIVTLNTEITDKDKIITELRAELEKTKRILDCYEIDDERHTKQILSLRTKLEELQREDE